jgi:hypothetical protein
MIIPVTVSNPHLCLRYPGNADGIAVMAERAETPGGQRLEA